MTTLLSLPHRSAHTSRCSSHCVAHELPAEEGHRGGAGGAFYVKSS